MAHDYHSNARPTDAQALTAMQETFRTIRAHTDLLTPDNYLTERLGNRREPEIQAVLYNWLEPEVTPQRAYYGIGRSFIVAEFQRLAKSGASAEQIQQLDSILLTVNTSPRYIKRIIQTHFPSGLTGEIRDSLVSLDEKSNDPAFLQENRINGRFDKFSALIQQIDNAFSQPLQQDRRKHYGDLHRTHAEHQHTEPQTQPAPAGNAVRRQRQPAP